jgi:hypothetical protein
MTPAKAMQRPAAAPVSAIAALWGVPVYAHGELSMEL